MQALDMQPLTPCCMPALRLLLPQKSATRLEMGEVAVNAAESAYDLVADMVRCGRVRLLCAAGREWLVCNGSGLLCCVLHGEEVQPGGGHGAMSACCSSWQAGDGSSPSLGIFDLHTAPCPPMGRRRRSSRLARRASAAAAVPRRTTLCRVGGRVLGLQPLVEMWVGAVWFSSRLSGYLPCCVLVPSTSYPAAAHPSAHPPRCPLQMRCCTSGRTSPR